MSKKHKNIDGSKRYEEEMVKTIEQVKEKEKDLKNLS